MLNSDGHRPSLAIMLSLTWGFNIGESKSSWCRTYQTWAKNGCVFGSICKQVKSFFVTGGRRSLLLSFIMWSWWYSLLASLIISVWIDSDAGWEEDSSSLLLWYDDAVVVNKGPLLFCSRSWWYDISTQFIEASTIADRFGSFASYEKYHQWQSNDVYGLWIHLIEKNNQYPFEKNTSTYIIYDAEFQEWIIVFATIVLSMSVFLIII